MFTFKVSFCPLIEFEKTINKNKGRSAFIIIATNVPAMKRRNGLVG